MNKKKWIIILIVVFIIPVIMMVYLVGCRQTRLESKLKKVLRDRYDEKFEVVDMYVLYGGLDSWPNKRYIATCRPVDNPDVVFEVDFWDDKIDEGKDNYFRGYVARMIDDFLQEDLEQFFPNCYVHCQSVGILKPQDDYVFNDKSLKEIINDCSLNESNEDVDIYIKKDVGTYKKYYDEYYFFTNTIDEYVKKKELGEINVKLYYVDNVFYDEIKDYYAENYEPSSMMLERMKTYEYMFASFQKDQPAYIENEGGLEEYIRRREEFESSNE